MTEEARNSLLFVLLFVLLPLVAGYLARRQGWLEARWSRPILGINIAAGATTLVFLVIWGKEIDRSLVKLPLVGLLLAAVMLLVGGLLSMFVLAARRARASFAFTSSLSNMGYSMGGIVTYAMLAKEGYGTSIIYLMFWSPYVFGLCFPLARALGRDRLSFQMRDFLSIFRDPRSLPLVGLAVGLALNFSGVPWPKFVDQQHQLGPLTLPSLISIIVSTAAATAMFAVGLSLYLGKLRRHLRASAVMCALKFLVSPAIALALMACLDVRGLNRQVVFILSCCPVAVYSVVISNLFDLDLHLANSLWVVTTVVFLFCVVPALVFVVPLLGEAKEAPEGSTLDSRPEWKETAMLNPYAPEGRWFKVNLHMHTSRSDGRLAPADAVEAYRRDGYHVLAVTDHDQLFGPGDLDDPGLLLLPAQEVHINGNTDDGCAYHFVALGVRTHIPRPGAGQDAVAAIRKQKGLAVLCHPLWSNMRQQEMDAITGCFAVEIWNGVCERMLGKGNSVFYWDSYLSRFDPVSLEPGGPRRPLWGIAVDDAHRYPDDLGQGWTWVQLPRGGRRPSVSAVLKALREGAFYSTRGPRIETLTLEDGVLRVHTSAAVSIRFVGKGARVRHRVSGEHLKVAEYEIDGEERYIRIEVEDRGGRSAWSNPIWIDELA